MTSQAVLRVGRGWLAAVMFGVCMCAQSAIMTKKDGQELPFVLTAAVRTATPPEIDGRLNDACWEEAAVADDFVLFGGRGYATVKTEARVLWDANNLYIGMRCFDANPALLKTAAVERDGRVCGDDCVEIFLIPPNNSVLARFPASSRYFHLAVNSAGVCWDEIGSEAPDSWNARWTARTSVHDNRWEVELSIPWAELKSKPRHQDIWDVNFNRGFPKRDQAAAEYSGWSITFSGFHDPEYFGKIVFLDRWPGGKKTVDAQIAADIVRKTELEPPLKQAEAALKSAHDKLRQLAGKSELRQVKEAIAAGNEQLAQAAGHAQTLAKESAASLLTQWEKLRDQFRECQKDAAALLTKADF
ncbi:MAG TPA: sugar-binding protein, partial [Lentisphaeria bacterium]|nr:sugar-binding protein [Lentisphaeria bacterium]